MPAGTKSWGPTDSDKTDLILSLGLTVDDFLHLPNYVTPVNRLLKHIIVNVDGTCEAHSETGAVTGTQDGALVIEKDGLLNARMMTRADVANLFVQYDSSYEVVIPQTAAPVVDAAVAGETTVSGTCAEEDGTVISVFVNDVDTETTSVTANAWETSAIAALEEDDVLKAKATAAYKTVSAFSAPVTVTAAP